MSCTTTGLRALVRKHRGCGPGGLRSSPHRASRRRLHRVDRSGRFSVDAGPATRTWRVPASSGLGLGFGVDQGAAGLLQDAVQPVKMVGDPVGKTRLIRRPLLRGLHRHADREQLAG